MPALLENVDDSKFKLTESSRRILSTMDLSGAYVQLLSTKFVNPMLYNLTIRVGGLPLKVDLKKPVGPGCYDRMYQLAVLDTNKEK